MGLYRKYKMRRIGKLNEKQMEISLKLIPGQYSARQAQMDLDKLTSKNEYSIDGDTYFGYEIKHTASQKVVVRHHSLRELVILAIDLWSSAAEV